MGPSRTPDQGSRGLRVWEPTVRTVTECRPGFAPEQTGVDPKCVDHGGAHSLVAEQILNGADELARSQQVFRAIWPARHIQTLLLGEHP